MSASDSASVWVLPLVSALVSGLDSVWVLALPLVLVSVWASALALVHLNYC